MKHFFYFVLLLLVTLTPFSSYSTPVAVDVSFSAVRRAFEGAKRSVNDGCADKQDGFICNRPKSLIFSSIDPANLIKGINMFNMTQCVNKVAGSPSSTSFNRTLYNTACFGSDGCLKDQKINNDGGLDQKDRVCVGAPVNEVFLL